MQSSSVAKSSAKVKKLVVLAMICALAYICVFVFRIKVSFLTFDAKSAIIALAALIYGPVSGVVVSLVVSFLEMFTVSDTGVYGFLMNFLANAVFAGTAGLIYKYKHSLGGAIAGLTASVISMTAVMLLANLWITPFYMGVSVDDVVAMIPTLLLPFNLIKAVLSAGLTYVLYRPVTTALRKTQLLPPGSQQSAEKISKGKSAALLVVAALLILLCVVVYLVVFNGNFQLFAR